MKTKMYTVLMIVWLLAVGCDVTPPPSGQNTYTDGGSIYAATPLPGQSAVDAQATIAAYNLVVDEQRRVEQATSDAAYAISYNATFEAEQFVIEMTRSAEVVAAASTAEHRQMSSDLSFEATRIYLERISADNVVAANFSATRTQAEANRLHQVAVARQVDIDRSQIYNKLLPWFAVFILFLFAGVVVAILRSMFSRHDPHVYDVNGNEILTLPGANGVHTVANGRLLAASNNSTDEVIEGELFEDVSVPSFSLLTGWNKYRQRKTHTLVGRGTADSLPIFIDRRTYPHSLLCGATRNGKTTGAINILMGILRDGGDVVAVNGMGGDLTAIENARHPNFIITDMSDDIEVAADQLIGLLSSVRLEVNRRNIVLKNSGVKEWEQLPDEFGEHGMLAIFIDELLSFVDDPDLSKKTADKIWSHIKNIVGLAGKFGVIMVLTMTDPTKDSIGKYGMKVRNQMAVIAYRMNSAAASRVILNIEKGADFVNGSAKFPVGQFLITVGGETRKGVGFDPLPEQVRSFVEQTPPHRRPLPMLISSAVESGRMRQPELLPDAMPVGANGQPINVPPPLTNATFNMAQSVTQAEVDARKLNGIIEGMNSLAAVGRHLGDADHPSKQFSEARSEPALEWRVEYMDCEQSSVILARRKRLS